MPQQIQVPGMGIVEFPDGMSDADITAAIQKNMPKGPSVGEDLTNVAKNAPGRVVAGLAGIPGDMLNLGTRLLGDNLTQQSAFGSQAISKALGSDYEAQTEPGRITQKVVDFAPAVVGGPETFAAKVATRVATPVVASEIGRQAAGPYGEVAGALAGAVGASSVANRFNQAMAAGRAAEPPTVAELKAAARAGYKSDDVKNVQIKPEALDNLATKIEQDLQFGANSGFRAANEGKVFNAVDELRNPISRVVGPDGPPSSMDVLENIVRKAFGDKPKAAGPANIDDIDSVRQLLNNISKERDASGQLTRQAVAANRAISHIDEFLPSLKQADLVAGDAALANAVLGEARANWGAAKRAEQVQTLLKNAEINAASANSGGNLQNAIKQAFKPMLKNDGAKAVGYSADELAALNNIVRGTWGGTAARAAGNLLGGGGGLGMLASGAVGYEAGGAPGAIAAGLAGRGLKKVGDRSTFNAVAKLDRLLRQRSPEAIKMAAANPQLVQALPPKRLQALRALILTDASLRNQFGQQVGQANAQ